MACLSPRKAWKAYLPNPTGKHSLVFSPRKGSKSTFMHVPCGQCIECRLEKSRQWALRCQKEAELYDANCVVTLTYDQANLPKNGSIQNEDVQLFMKRLRERMRGSTMVIDKDGKATWPIRSYGCAEYGEKWGRPHYHIILFNLDFPDKTEDPEMDPGEYKYYVSETLDQLWDMGKTQIMDLNFETAAYVARYVTKKINGPGHTRVHVYEGKFVPIADERSIAVSRRPGIGKRWYEKNKQHIYKQDTVFERGMQMRPPKYFDSLFEKDNPDGFLRVKQKRKREEKIKNDKVEKEIRNGDLTNAFNRGFRSRDKANLRCAEAKTDLLKRKLDK